MDRSNDIKELIVQHHQHHFSVRDIATMTNVPRASVHRVIKRYVSDNTITSRRSRCGRKKKLSERYSRAIVRASVQDPTACGKILQQRVGGEALNIHVATVCRILKRYDRDAYRPRKAPSISVVAKRRRLQWCQQYQHWTVDHWQRVVFSDECSVHIARHKPQYVRRRRQETIKQAHCVQHKPFLRRLMVWACISMHGPGPLVPIDGKLNAPRYVMTLQNYLEPILEEWFNGADCYFQQDNAPCHTAAFTQQWLQFSGIEVLPWPPYSPDLNCI